VSKKPQGVHECPRYCAEHDQRYTSIKGEAGEWSGCPTCAVKPKKVSANTSTREVRCDKHGMYESRHYLGTVWSRCPRCAEEEAAERERQQELEAREARNRAWIDALGYAQIPERFIDRTLATYVATTEGQRRALAFATDYANTFQAARGTGRSALFCGTPGTGKTHLAIGIAMHIMRDAKYSALFTTTLRAIRRVKDTWNRAHARESESQAIAALVFPDLLILDEVGVQFGSEAEKTILFDILNERYERCKPTLMLSNLPVDEVRGYLGDRIFSRLRESGGEYVVFDWEDHRGKRPDSAPTNG
jgi:DNA replication protein DnaC